MQPPLLFPSLTPFTHSPPSLYLTCRFFAVSLRWLLFCFRHAEFRRLVLFCRQISRAYRPSPEIPLPPFSSLLPPVAISHRHGLPLHPCLLLREHHQPRSLFLFHVGHCPRLASDSLDFAIRRRFHAQRDDDDKCVCVSSWPVLLGCVCCRSCPSVLLNEPLFVRQRHHHSLPTRASSLPHFHACLPRPRPSHVHPPAHHHHAARAVVPTSFPTVTAHTLACTALFSSRHERHSMSYLYAAPGLAVIADSR